jgi:hypothetical protein
VSRRWSRTVRAGSEGRARTDQRHAAEPCTGARWLVRCGNAARCLNRDRRADSGWSRRQLRALRCAHSRSEPLAESNGSRTTLPPATHRQRDSQRS